MVLTLFFTFFTLLTSDVQDEYPVTWHVTTDRKSGNQYEIQFEAYISEGWVIYGMDTPVGGPIGTTFDYEADENYKLLGDTKEITTPESKFEPLFDIEVLKFSKKAVFAQNVSQFGSSRVLKGNIRYMACDGTKCLPPTDVPFVALLR